MNRKFHNPLALGLLRGASKDVIELLLDAGCSLASLDHYGSVFHCAIYGKYALQKDVIYLLIERGANVNATNSSGCSVICEALKQHISKSSIQKLCDAGAQLDCPKHSHPLICTTIEEDTNGLLRKTLVKYLLLKAAPFNKIDSQNLTPLQAALRYCYYEVGAIHLLLQHFPDVNILDKSNNNLLHLALSSRFSCDVTTIKLLIKQGVCVDKANSDGETPLHRAVSDPHTCNWRVIELLIKSGAVVNAVDCRGKTPLERLVEHVRASDDIYLTFKVILSAGAYRQFILEKVADKCNRTTYTNHFLKYLKTLLQYNLLENPNLCIEDKLTGHKDYEVLSKYWKDCVFELKRMESVTVGISCTLRKFLNSYFTPSNEAANCKPQVEKYDCDQLLRIKANNVFPLFSGIISDKVDRCIMEAKLQEVLVYSMKCFPHQACREEKVQLPYEAVSEIVQYLGDDDLFSFIVAFTYMDEPACISNPEKHIGGKKRSSKELTEYRKKLRSHKV